MIAEGALSGLHRAAARGSSVEFAEFKEYSPGDEIRHIDWRVYAKADRYVVRQFEQETELTAQLVLDASASMSYRGSTKLSKFAYGAHLIGALCHLLIRQRDRAGLLLFGDRTVDHFVPPRSRASHEHDLLTVMERALSKGPGGDESVAEALERIAEVTARKRQLIVIASDFFDQELSRTLDALKWLRARGHDMVVFHILDPDELNLPFEGLTKFVSFEAKRELLASPRSISREYTKRLHAFLDKIASECIAAGVEYYRAPTHYPLETLIGSFLASRSRDARRQAPPELSWSS